MNTKITLMQPAEECGSSLWADRCAVGPAPRVAATHHQLSQGEHCQVSRPTSTELPSLLYLHAAQHGQCSSARYGTVRFVSIRYGTVLVPVPAT